jgi:catabolite repression protein CreC
MMENELTFVAPEGVYSVTENHKPIPVIHNAPPPTYPTRLATITVRFPAKQPAAQGLGQLLGGGKDFWKEKAEKAEKGLAVTTPAKEDGVSVSSGETPEDVTSPDIGSTQDTTPPASIGMPDQNHGLFSPPLGGKRRALSRPKHNMRTTSSQFITRVQCIEGLAKMLQAKQGEATYVFYNSAKNLYWVEAGVQAKVLIAHSSNRESAKTSSLQEALARVAFAVHPTCHDVNHTTASHEHLDLIIGFQTGDLIWLGESESLDTVSFLQSS